MSKFDTYEVPIKKYCEENGISFEALADLKVLWGIDTLNIMDSDSRSVLKVTGYDMNDLLFEHTDLIEKYRLHGAVAV